MRKVHVAIKCTYNNGDEGEFVGFNGKCTGNIRRYNIRNRVWCMESSCNIPDEDNDPFPCNESYLFSQKDEYIFGLGYYWSGIRAGDPIPTKLEPGGLCVLTTRYPETPENERFIIGFYKVAEVTGIEDDEQAYIISDKTLKVRLPLKAAKKLMLWKYYTINSNTPKWGTGLFRYLKDEQAYRILIEAKRILLDLEYFDVSEIVDRIIIDLFKKNESHYHENTYPLFYNSCDNSQGEGEEHFKLKNLIANNPEIIGITDLRKTEIEHTFPSGDRVDILFCHKKGKDSIVEIEVDNPLPGCFQAIKYRALRCAERGLPLDSEDVKAIIVARIIPPRVQKFCEKYNIQYYKVDQ